MTQSTPCTKLACRCHGIHQDVFPPRLVQLYPIRPGSYLANVGQSIMFRCLATDGNRCEHTGVACFTVRRKNAQGQWVEKDEVKRQ